ncbi:MAG: hypothetical protein RLY93_12530 [Sumerlaeia bacterium]
MAAFLALGLVFCYNSAAIASDSTVVDWKMDAACENDFSSFLADEDVRNALNERYSQIEELLLEFEGDKLPIKVWFQKSVCMDLEKLNINFSRVDREQFPSFSAFIRWSNDAFVGEATESINTVMREGITLQSAETDIEDFTVFAAAVRDLLRNHWCKGENLYIWRERLSPQVSAAADEYGNVVSGGLAHEEYDALVGQLVEFDLGIQLKAQVQSLVKVYSDDRLNIFTTGLYYRRSYDEDPLEVYNSYVKGCLDCRIFHAEISKHLNGFYLYPVFDAFTFGKTRKVHRVSSASLNDPASDSLIPFDVDEYCD